MNSLTLVRPQHDQPTLDPNIDDESLDNELRQHFENGATTVVTNSKYEERFAKKKWQVTKQGILAESLKLCKQQYRSKMK